MPLTADELRGIYEILKPAADSSRRKQIGSQGGQRTRTDELTQRVYDEWLAMVKFEAGCG